MLGNISAGRLCRSACFEFLSQTSSTHRLKEDLEPLFALPAPRASSCFSTDPVQNSTWEAAAPAEPRGGPGQEGLGDPSLTQLEAEPPRRGASRKPQGSRRLTRERRITGGGDQPVSRPSSSGGAMMGTMEVAGGFSFWNLSQPDLPVAPYSILSKYGPVSFGAQLQDLHARNIWVVALCRFRTQRPPFVLVRGEGRGHPQKQPGQNRGW